MLPSIQMLSLSVIVCSISTLVRAATVTYDFNITWVMANPDGLFDRATIGINGQWPLPSITAMVGDRVVVNVVNQLENQTTSLHFHGLFQTGSTHMDGAAGVTQCPIPPGASFSYDFKADQPGTYWYHSHDKGQYPDGLRGPIIIDDPISPYKDHYDEELVLTLSDWYHEQVPNLLTSFSSVLNPSGAEPVPNSALMNDTQNLTVLVEPGKTYMIHIINMAALAPQYLWFEDHTMQIVEVDGVYTEAVEAKMIYVAPAQRYSVLLKAKHDTSSNFAFVGSMDGTLFDKSPAKLNPNVTGWLVYDRNKVLPTPSILEAYEPFDDFTLVPYDREVLLDNVDQSITLNFAMGNLGDGANYAFFNNVTYVKPIVPTLYTALSAGASANDATVYGSHTNSFVLHKDEVIEIIVNSEDSGKHPFHLHGHNFQAVVRSEPVFPSLKILVFDFPADESVRPRVWLFHCHIEWHMSSGLVATMVEAPLDLQSSLNIPADHLKACYDQNIPSIGNAAGNMVDYFDLSGENASPAPLPTGFTSKGIVALVFSCLSAILGLAVIAWYGVGELGPSELAAVERTIAQAEGVGRGKSE